jgi:SAM-dependent methyltransferase
MTGSAAEHNQVVADQFGKQAAGFARLPGHEDATRLPIEAAEMGANDEVLDVACGPGLVACAAARGARHVVGIDLTPAMIEEAKALQSRLGLSNLEWHIGDVAALPFATDRFAAVLIRYSLHHMLDPKQALSEMVRVVRPGGRVVIADIVLPTEHGRAYDDAERLRDPSHVRVLSNVELGRLIADVGLVEVKWTGYLFELELKVLLQRSFPRPGDADRVRDLFEQDVGVNRLGIGLHRHNGEIRLAYPIARAEGRASRESMISGQPDCVKTVRDRKLQRSRLPAPCVRRRIGFNESAICRRRSTQWSPWRRRLLSARACGRRWTGRLVGRRRLPTTGDVPRRRSGRGSARLDLRLPIRRDIRRRRRTGGLRRALSARRIGRLRIGSGAWSRLPVRVRIRVAVIRRLAVVRAGTCLLPRSDPFVELGLRANHLTIVRELEIHIARLDSVKQPAEIGAGLEPLAVERGDLVAFAQSRDERRRVRIDAQHDQAIGIAVVEDDAEVRVIVIVRFIGIEDRRLEVDDLFAAISKYDHLDPISRVEREAIEILGALEPIAVDRNDNVAGPQPGTDQRAIGRQIVDSQSAVRDAAERDPQVAVRAALALCRLASRISAIGAIGVGSGGAGRIARR